MRWRHTPYTLLFFPLVFILFYGNQFLFLSGAEFSDLLISHLPNALFLQRAWLEWGQIPLWSPAILSGFPFVANPLSGLFYPPGWLAVFWPDAWMFNLLAGLHLVWGGVGLCVLLRGEGLGPIPAILGGVAFSLMPKLMAHYGAGHVTLVYAVSWTPWLLVASRGLQPGGQKKGWILEIGYWPAIILALIFFADVRWAAFSGLLWAGWWMWKTTSRALVLLLQLGIAAGLSAPLALPLVEFVRLSTRASLGAEDVLAFSLPPVRLLGFLFPELGGMQEWVVYPGMIVLALALTGWIQPEMRRRGRFWWGVWLVSVLLSLGEHVPGMTIFAHLPGFSLLRVPSRAMFLAGMALVVLAAFSLEGLLNGLKLIERRRAMRILVSLFGAAFTIGVGVWGLTGAVPLNFVMGAAMAGVALLGGAWLLKAQRPLPGWVGFLLIGISVIELGVVAARSFSPRPAQEIWAEQAALAEFLAGQEGMFRIYSPSYSLPQHTAARFDLELADGVDPMQLQAYAAFMDAATGVPRTGYSITVPPFDGDVSSANQRYIPNAELLGWLNVKYVVAGFDIQADGLSWVQTFGATRVYENRLVRPRAWVEEVNGLRAAAVNWSPDRIEVRASGPRILMLSELQYPGWQVNMDGLPEEMIVTANGLLRGVELPAGEHIVVFEFHPASLSLGVGLFLATVLWLVLNLFFRIARRVPTEAS